MFEKLWKNDGRMKEEKLNIESTFFFLKLFFFKSYIFTLNEATMEY